MMMTIAAAILGVVIVAAVIGLAAWQAERPSNSDAESGGDERHSDNAHGDGGD